MRDIITYPIAKTPHTMRRNLHRIATCIKYMIYFHVDLDIMESCTTPNEPSKFNQIGKKKG